MNEKAIAALELFSNDELRSQSIVYRKLCGLGFPKEAVTILRMERADYECFIMNTCDIDPPGN